VVEHEAKADDDAKVKKARRLGIAVMAFAAGLFVFAAVWNAGAFQSHWKRKNPLINPIRVVAVKDGALTLESGRVLRPAGIVRAVDVSSSSFDQALRVATFQGVVVTRDLGDGRALLLAEPKFYNWCGTSQRDLGWMGSCYQMPLSEAMVFLNYAVIDAAQQGLTARERWRIEGASTLTRSWEDGPVPLSSRGDSFRYEASSRYFDPAQYDDVLAAVWREAPVE